MKALHNDSGISENIGIILMVSVVVLGAAIISVTVTSEPAPEKIPNADIIIGCEDAAGGIFNVTLFHNGGDTLIPNDLEVRAYDSDNQPIEITLYEGESTDPFAVSDTLTFSTDTQPARISVIYTGGTSSAALKSLDIGSTVEDDQAAQESASVDTPASPTATPTGGGEPTPTVTPSVTPTPGSPGTPADNVTLNAQRKGYIQQNSYIEFTILDSSPASSWIRLKGGKYNFNAGDRVKLVIGGDGYGHIDIYGNPQQITQFRFNHVDIYCTYGGSTHFLGRENLGASDIYIGKYADLVSTLTIIVPSQDPANGETQLIIDNHEIFGWGDYPRNAINIYNLLPDPRYNSNYALFDNIEGNNHCYYVGGCERYEVI